MPHAECWIGKSISYYLKQQLLPTESYLTSAYSVILKKISPCLCVCKGNLKYVFLCSKTQREDIFRNDKVVKIPLFQKSVTSL